MTAARLIATTALIATLAACNQAETPAASGPNGAEPADAPASNVQAPRLRPGLWSVTTTSDGVGQTSRMCIDDAVQDRMSVIGGQMASGLCEETVMTARPGGGWSMRSVCDMGQGGRMVSQGTVTGDFQTGYRSETTVSTTGASLEQMNRTVTSISDARYDGPCIDGMKPGDIELAGGMRINMLEMAEQSEAGR